MKKGCLETRRAVTSEHTCETNTFRRPKKDQNKKKQEKGKAHRYPQEERDRIDAYIFCNELFTDLGMWMDGFSMQSVKSGLMSNSVLKRKKIMISFTIFALLSEVILSWLTEKLIFQDIFIVLKY